MFAKFRLLPVLIFVSMLAFSVRLADVMMGISHLSGSAYAESPTDKKPPEPPPLPADPAALPATGAAENIKTPDTKTAETETKDTPKNEAAPESKENLPADEEAKTDCDTTAKEKEWRDAGDSDLDTQGVKMEVLQDLSSRSTKLDDMEKSLKAREALLKATEQEIDRKYQELTKLRTEIEGLLGKQTEEEDKRIASLVKIYEGMKPDEAARIFDTLDLDILVSVVSKMSERKISSILGIMTPERAKTLTTMLAEQKKLPTLGPN